MTKRAARPPSPAPHRAASACSLMATTPTAPSRPHAPAAPVAEPGSGALRNLGCPQTWQAGKHAWASKSDRGARLDRSSARQARGAGLAAAAQSGQRWVGGRGHEPDGASPWRGRGLQHMRRGLAPGPPAPPGYARQRVQQRRHVVDQHLRHDVRIAALRAAPRWPDNRSVSPVLPNQAMSLPCQQSGCRRAAASWLPCAL